MRFSAMAVLAAASPAFGPDGCVTIARSDQGTCVISTHCGGHDTSQFEFAFVCEQADGSRVKHTFGEGGFEVEEDYDSDVKCAVCSPPPGTAAAVAPTPAASVQLPVPADSHVGGPLAGRATLQQFAAAKADPALPPASAAFYGPGGCVSAYRDPEGTCIMQTRCTPEQVAGYNFGLSCVDAAGDTSRHLFGVGSFDPVEKFNTLVECQLCLGLDGAHIGGIADSATLAKDVAELKQEMHDLQAGVREIKDHLGLASANATAAATAATPTTAGNATTAPTAATAADAGGEATTAPTATAVADAGDEEAASDEDEAADDAASDADADAAASGTSSFLHRRPRRGRQDDDDLDELVRDALDDRA